MSADDELSLRVELDMLQAQLQAQREHVTSLAEVAHRWADPPPELIGHLPRTTCRACKDNRQTGVCDRHEKRKCPLCQQYTTTAHVDIAFLGHADTTRLLLEADPLWSWEPLGFNPDGSPAMIRDGKRLLLWGKLTVLGQSRIGVGSVDAGKDEPEKEVIGDFIRNAAMRFGIGLGLWSKSDRAAAAVATETAPSAPRSAPEPSPAPTTPEPANQDQADEIRFLSSSVLDAVQRAAMREWSDDNGLDLKHLTYAQAEAVIDKMRAMALEPATVPEPEP